MGWREDKATKKQIDFIRNALEMSDYRDSLERFDFENATKGSASDWISRNGKLATSRILDDFDLSQGRA